MKATIIDEPWVSLLLSGTKTWALCSRHTPKGGRIELIRKGKGQVAGAAGLVDSFSPLDEIAWRAHQSRHRISLRVGHGSTVKQGSLPKPETPQGGPASDSFPDEVGLSLVDIAPVAKDGTGFAPTLRRSGGFTFGAKGEDSVLGNYAGALTQLRDMAVRRWRRPNSKGSSGIVSGVRWNSPTNRFEKYEESAKCKCS